VTPVAEFTSEYANALQEYLDRGGEASLLRAYELGRSALALKLGVLEIAALHQEALVSILLGMLAPAGGQEASARAGEFFVEAIAPFEISRRGAQEANDRFEQLNRQLEQRIRSTEAQLAEKRRMEGLKDEFISVASHELRTPLTSIHGSLGLLRAGVGGGELPEKMRMLLDVAQRNTERLVRLVNDILDAQKIESGATLFRIRSLPIRPILEQAQEANLSYAKSFEVSIAISEVAEDAAVLADPDRVLQILTNLISNAVKFSPRGGTVSLGASRNSGFIRFSVADRGPGIPEAFRGRIFQKFAQADASCDRRKRGTGLGLSITKAIVERLSGHIDFTTEEGRGTTFFFDLLEYRKGLERAAGKR
jgi:signal transduction histidine kinase